MAVFLVDYENVCNKGGLKGVEFLNENDTIIIFYSESCPSIRGDYMNCILRSGCGFITYKLVRTGKNGLDFYIAVEVGALAEKGERQMAIISNDKGFNAVIDFIGVKYKSEDFKILKTPDIENGMMGLSDPNGCERRKRIHDSMDKLDIGQEYAMYRQRNEFKRMIADLLTDTEYSDRLAEIIQFVSDRREAPKKDFYTGTLHRFGRSDGIAIYRLIKDAI